MSAKTVNQDLEDLESTLKKLDTPTDLPLEKEVALLEASKGFLAQIESPEFKELSYDAKFTLVYMFAQFDGTNNGQLEAPRLIPRPAKDRKK